MASATTATGLEKHRTFAWITRYSKMRNGWKHQAVYDVLLEYHRSLPLDSIYRSFVIVKYYEDLVPAPVPVVVEVEVPEMKEPQPEIIIIGRAIRVWRFMQDGDKVRIIGKAAS
jgi:hypothetical protein